jgi:hypothetical protein
VATTVEASQSLLDRGAGRSHFPLPLLDFNPGADLQSLPVGA